MTSKKLFWQRWLLAGTLIGALAFAAATLFPQTSFAQAGGEAEPTEPWGRGEGLFGMRGLGGMQGDHAKFLAEALGISVEALQAAQQKAHAAMLAQAVEEGALTQEEADLLQARHAFMRYAANENAQSLEEALNAAVEAGALTQEQANLLREAQGSWERQPFGRGMHGRGMHGRGMEGWNDHGGFPPHGRMPGEPAATPEANS
ncbi:MAG: hypothetical protein NTV69_10815 [Caldilinea sp.]|jgi:hypothetical protein|nr:hypothetical protein [Caldilinea sp.]